MSSLFSLRLLTCFSRAWFCSFTRLYNTNLDAIARCLIDMVTMERASQYPELDLDTLQYVFASLS